MLSTLFLFFVFVPFVAADNWDDFTNNLATDLVCFKCRDRDLDWVYMLTFEQGTVDYSIW
jgi:hypothetical protein